MWAYGTATNVGAIHGEHGSCQDFALARLVHAPGGQVVLAFVADGAGSTEHGGIGARIACESFVSGLETALMGGQEPNRPLVQGVFVQAVEAIREAAEEAEREIAEFSSTLVGAIVGAKEAFFFQVGDGAAIYRLGKEYSVAIWPEESEFVNTTVFVTTPGAAEKLQIRRIAGMIEEVALITDGLQYLVLDFKAQAAHQKFFNSVSEQIGTQPPGESEFIGKWLAALLAAPQVTSRSDDDTGITYVRRAVEAHV